MKVVITGGSGFLGLLLARRLLELGELTGPSGGREAIDSLVLFDAVAAPAAAVADERVENVIGDVSDADLVRSVIDRDDISLFHLASMVSAGSELDFDAAMTVNLDGGRAVLEACRARASQPRLVFTSSIVGFGGVSEHDIVSDETKLTPETTYGATKAICELLVNDYTRKGFLDGRSPRLPTVIIRPGRPNSAASSWVSGLFREPLAGEECVVPVNAELALPVSGYRTVVENLIHLHEVDAAALGADRSLNLPALSPTVADMISALERAADRPLAPITVHPEPSVVSFFHGWARASSFERATSLGLARDATIEAIVAEYLDDYLATPRNA